MSWNEIRGQREDRVDPAPTDPASAPIPQTPTAPTLRPVDERAPMSRYGRAVASESAVSRLAHGQAGVAARRAGQVGRAVAYRTTRPIVNLFAGIGCVPRGAGRFASSPSLWPYAIVPLALLALVMYGIVAAAEAGAHTLVDWLLSFADDWPGWMRTVLATPLEWSAYLAIHAAVGYLVLPLSIVLGAPCYVLLARRLERVLGAAHPDPPPLWRACGSAVRQAVLVTVVLQLGWLLLTPVLLIPGVNVLAALIAVAAFNGFFVGLLVLAIPLRHHGIATFRGQLREVWRHRASAIGFGATSGLLLSVPVTPVRALVAPVVFTGAVLLHRRMRGPRHDQGVLDVARTATGTP
ncbi:EI24 domain-containing protein [Actinomycetes bacterium KLBMP 9797]